MKTIHMPFLVLMALFATACSSTPQPSSTPLADAVTVEQTLSTGEVGRSTVALSEDGRTAYVSWVQKSESGWNVYLQTSNPDEPVPDSTVRVNSTEGNAASHAQAPPQVGVDSEGRVYVVWINRIDVPGRRFPANDLFLAVSEDGGRTFGPEIPVNSDYGGKPAGHTFHNLTALADGAMLISWIDSRERTPSEAGADMNDHAAMHEKVGSQIRVARVEDGGGRILETAILDHSSCPCCRTSMAVGEDGRILVTWRHEFESGERDIVLAHSDDGGRTFSDWRPIHRDHWWIEGCPHTGPVLAFNASGDVHAAWYSGAEPAGIRHAVSRDNGLSFDDVSVPLAGIPIAQTAFLGNADENPLLVGEDPIGRRLVALSGPGETPLLEWSGELPSAARRSSATVLTWRDGNAIKLQWRLWS